MNHTLRATALVLQLTSSMTAAPGCAQHGATVESTTARSEGLSLEQRSIIPVASFTANGDQPQLRTALIAGLSSGSSVNELEEVLVQMYAYAGFPRSLNAINTFIDVLEERRRQGIVDEMGKEPSPPPPHRSSIEIGTEVQTKLVGGPATAPYVEFSPTIDAFLKGHLFGDILARDNLDIQKREIATLSALAALEGVNPQLSSHFKVAFNVGLSEAQLRHLVAVVGETLGRERGDNAREVLAQVLRGRQDGPAPPAATAAAPPSPSEAPTLTVRRGPGQGVETGPAEHFTGVVRVQRLFQPSDGARTSGASVSFEAGARSAWHAHPLGQTLIVSEGTGWVQQRGAAAQLISAGDVVWTPPGVEHWHGASAGSAMTHLAIQEQIDGKAVQWLEQVGDEQYEAAERTR